ncbi:hypothetical protein J0383_18780 [Flavobacterium endoglycinae]|uniref:Uncharacterized protein n=1 Tax=Flavobacterium endoglycinae TaxID=2816357 RepID=A0ABX7QB80_9FLAO|nr:hypothetical protein [Flavobacterium endoglycinae]QSW88295.1 hypothetical protein J0383_18780 [Flavobacterium endoglycinae]
MKIRTLTIQEYENSQEVPNSEICFYTTEKDIMERISRFLAENIKENIEILKQLQPFKIQDVYEITTKNKTLYLIHTEVID